MWRGTSRNNPPRGAPLTAARPWLRRPRPTGCQRAWTPRAPAPASPSHGPSQPQARRPFVPVNEEHLLVGLRACGYAARRRNVAAPQHCSDPPGPARTRPPPGRERQVIRNGNSVETSVLPHYPDKSLEKEIGKSSKRRKINNNKNDTVYRPRDACILALAGGVRSLRGRLCWFYPTAAD